MATEKQIIQEATGSKPFDQLSPEAQYYRAYGRMPEKPQRDLNQAGAFVQSGQIPELQVQGATVQDGNVVEVPLGKLAKEALDNMYSKGYVLNPSADLNNPRTQAEFLKIAEGEVNPYYKSQFGLAREQLLRSQGYSTDALNAYESELQRKYGQQVRDIASNMAEQGFAQSGIRGQRELGLAQNVQEQLEQNRRQLGFQLGTQAREFAQQYGGVLGGGVPGAPQAASARVLPGVGEFQRGPQSAFYDLSDEIYQNLIGSEEFNRRAAIASRTSELEGARRTLDAQRYTI